MSFSVHSGDQRGLSVPVRPLFQRARWGEGWDHYGGDDADDGDDDDDGDGDHDDDGDDDGGDDDGGDAKHNLPVDDVEELFHHGNLFEHKLHFPVNILLKQMNIRKLSITNKYAESQF